MLVVDLNPYFPPIYYFDKIDNPFLINSSTDTSVLAIFSSYQNYRINVARNKENFDAEFVCVKYSDALEIAKDKNIKEVSICYDYGMSKENLNESNTSFKRIHLLGYDSNKLKNSGFKIISGRMPQNSNEILLNYKEANGDKRK